MVTFTEVAAPVAPVPNSINLLASAEQPSGGDEWMHGVAWMSEACPAWQGFNPCTELDEAPPEGNASLIYAQPVGYRVAFECVTRSGPLPEDRARKQAEAVASFVVARELWTGDLSKLDPYDLPMSGGTDQVNPHLEQVELANQLTAATDPMAAVAALEAAVGEATLGGPVFIHGSVSLIGTIAQNLERVGNELRTRTGATVIPDAGYPGTGPDGTGSGWLYGTGPIVVRLGSITADSNPTTTVDRTTNRRRVIAERLFGVAFDPCALHAVQVTG